MNFDRIIEKISVAEFQSVPFRHILIEDLFDPEDFGLIVSADDIKLGAQSSDEELFTALFAAGYKIIDFPGCITDRQAYLKWHKSRDKGNVEVHSACEGFGMTLRLEKPISAATEQLMNFLNSDRYTEVLARKFGFDPGDLVYDAGIQKYLDGYEISPHPDIRKKALTFMVNINPSSEAEKNSHHTHYMRFSDPYQYVQSYWTHNEKVERCWVPWDWCQTVAMQPRNNSMVIFAPSSDTLHAVKADYDHLGYQRTQLYGNFWHKESHTTTSPSWEDLVISESVAPISLTSKLKSVTPGFLKRALKRGYAGDQDVIEKRFYQR